MIKRHHIKNYCQLQKALYHYKNIKIKFNNSKNNFLIILKSITLKKINTSYSNTNFVNNFQ